MMGIPLPFRHHESRWDRLRSVASNELERALHETERLRVVLPETGNLRRRVQPLMDRASAARADFSMPDLPAGLHDRLSLDRLPMLGHKRPSRLGRILNADTPLWAVIAAGLGGFLAGAMIARGATAQRMPAAMPEDLDRVSEQIKGEWPSILDEDIRDAKGNLKRLSSVIGERTGEDKGSVRERLQELTSATMSSNGGHT